ncbi:bacteriocin-associated integral membrane family protein [Streptomyces sp. NPDC005931]|uniref:bacteriocin-associated integral membrane family protein n=1 Tax=Streptomyces sp. NPDC005931 TaxID=3364737 RepID=UPI00367F7378
MLTERPHLRFQMLHRGIRFVHAAVLAFSAALTFMFVRGLDDTSVLGNSALVDVVDTDGSTNGARVIHAVESFSAERGIGVAREVADLRNPDGRRHLYMAPGRPGSMTAAWLDEGYPAFSRNYETRVHPISEIRHQDPRGSYYVFGPHASADALVAELRGLGLTTQVTHPLSYAELADRYADDPLIRALCVVALAALAMTGASVLLNTKTYGILRMQGMSLPGILLRDLRGLVVFWLASAGTVAVTSLVVLGFYNGFAWLGLFAAVAAVVAALLTVLVVATHAAVLSLTFRVGILRALKGELPSRAASVSVYLVRIPALLLALGIATNVTVAGRDVMMRLDNRDVYDTVGDAVSIRLSGAFAMHTDQLDAHVGPWLREADKRGDIVLAGRRDLQVSAPGARLPPGEILIVNDTYLEKQPVLDPAGKRYASEARTGEAPDARPVRVIIPASLSTHTAAIKEAASDIIDQGRSRNIPLKILHSSTGQSLFGYNTGAYAYSSAHGPEEDRSMVRDPVLLAVPNGSHLLSDDAYTTYATQAGVVFPDPNDVMSGIEAHKLQSYISAMSPVGQKTALDLRNAVNELRLQMFNLIVAVMVLLIAGVGVCIIYSRKNAQTIFVRHFSGWRYVAIHRFIIIVEAAIAVVFATRVPFEAWQQRQELKELAALGAPAPFQPTHLTGLDIGVLTGLVAFEFGAVLLALAFFHRRIVKEGATAG